MGHFFAALSLYDTFDDVDQQIEDGKRDDSVDPHEFWGFVS